MPVEIIPDDFDIDQYNSVASHPLQSWQWGEARKKMGIKVLRLGLFDNTKSLKEVYQMTIHPLPHTSYALGYIPRSLFPPKAILTFLEDFAKKNHLIFVKFEPNVTKESFDQLHTSKSCNFLLPSKHPLFPEWTMLLDISKSEEQLLAEMKNKTRYNIRLAQKKGVTVEEESNEKGFETFSKLYFETTRRQKYFGHTPSYHKTIWETLKGSLSHILVARHENDALAAYELFYFNDILYYPYGGTSEIKRNLMGANAIMWESIRLGKKLGAKQFEMWGALSPGYDMKHPWAGFTRFKEGYGAIFQQMCGSYDLVVNKPLYKLYSIANILRKLYLKLRN
ncbi:peptidoglycan bridge formation glycyltransferase FemA/FemB family protein [Candidatus Roizmanbacteria bacterium]|nr:peptidoglycan bridge formation glycyltransferase FemA/FemB family protein [Candidatus Roizmanbacteria bacterium]